jgi:4-hydroxybenzoate polyprenyltransferase
MKNWWIFIKERFEPGSHSIMIVVFVTVHYLMVKKLNLLAVSTSQIVCLYLAVTLFYFKLRLYDEVKDYELDVVINKHRPLPRGLLNHKDMYKGMIFCILGELTLFQASGVEAYFALLIAVLYSLLMYKEFFIREYIRPHLTTYAMTHTIVTSFLSLAIFSFLTKESFIKVVQDKNFLLFAFINWLLFNIFEFGRKTFSTVEERDDVDTYSSLFGRKGAALLVISQRVLSAVLIVQLPMFQTKMIVISFVALLLFLLVISLKYIYQDAVKNAKLFRVMSSAYIVIFYLILTVGLVSN